MLRCQNGHYYDEKKYMICPYCGIFAEDDAITQKLSAKKTDVSDDPATVRVSRGDDAVHDYLTGWLVCVSGMDVGRDYRIFKGQNFVGRDYDMDIRIENDNTVSRRKHCSIVYEDRENRFYAVPMDNLVYVDGNLLNQATEIRTGQEIQIGDTTLVFIPFCEGERRWEKEN